MLRRSPLLLLALLAVGACQDRLPVQPPLSRGLPAVTSSGGGDPALAMRAAGRARGDAEFARAVEHSGLVVTVGFKPEKEPWGVDAGGRVLVSDQDKAKYMDYVAQRARRVLRRFETIPAITIELPNAQVAVALRHLPWVDYVAEATQLLSPDAVMVECFDAYGNPPPRGSASGPQLVTWNVSRVRADAAWSIATGVNPLNQELSIMDDGADEQQANVPLGTELANATAYLWYVAPSTYDGTHGTPVLGSAIAANNSVGVVGVAPGATARVEKIFDPAGDQRWDYWAYFAIDGNSRFSPVMSLSYSTKQWTSSTPPSSFTPMYDAIRTGYYTYGTVFVASTGNQSQSNWYAFPAAFPEVVGVGGSGYSDEYEYNNYAPGNVELAAPAVDVGTVCKGGQTGWADGTSFATPMVAGAFMILRERFPSETPAQLRNRLTSTAVSMGDTRKSGAGRIDVYAALTQ